MYIGGLSVIPLERCHAHVLQAKAVAKSRRYFTRDLARRWRKRLDKSTEEIEAAVAKVGNNATSVIKELETKRA